MKQREREIEKESRARRASLPARRARRDRAHDSRVARRWRGGARRAGDGSRVKASSAWRRSRGKRSRSSIGAFAGGGDDDDAASPDLDGEPNDGDVVEITTLGDRLGRVLERREQEAVVAVGGIKMTLPLTALRRSLKQEAAAARGGPDHGRPA